MYSNDEILKRIEQLRIKMAEVVEKQGFTSEEALAISREIDILLNKYNRNKE